MNELAVREILVNLVINISPRLIKEDIPSIDKAIASLRSLFPSEPNPITYDDIFCRIRNIYIDKIYSDKPHGLSDKDIGLLARGVEALGTIQTEPKEMINKDDLDVIIDLKISLENHSRGLDVVEQKRTADRIRAINKCIDALKEKDAELSSLKARMEVGEIEKRLYQLNLRNFDKWNCHLGSLEIADISTAIVKHLKGEKV